MSSSATSHQNSKTRSLEDQFHLLATAIGGFTLPMMLRLSVRTFQDPSRELLLLSVAAILGGAIGYGLFFPWGKQALSSLAARVLQGGAIGLILGMVGFSVLKWEPLAASTLTCLSGCGLIGAAISWALSLGQDLKSRPQSQTPFLLRLFFGNGSASLGAWAALLILGVIMYNMFGSNALLANNNAPAYLVTAHSLGNSSHIDPPPKPFAIASASAVAEGPNKEASDHSNNEATHRRRAEKIMAMAPQKLLSRFEQLIEIDRNSTIAALDRLDPQAPETKKLRKTVAKTYKSLAFQASSAETQKAGVRGMVRWGGKFSVPYLEELLDSNPATEVAEEVNAALQSFQSGDTQAANQVTRSDVIAKSEVKR